MPYLSLKIMILIDNKKLTKDMNIVLPLCLIGKNVNLVIVKEYGSDDNANR